jgi:hypothetical protein
MPDGGVPEGIAPEGPPEGGADWPDVVFPPAAGVAVAVAAAVGVTVEVSVQPEMAAMASTSRIADIRYLLTAIGDHDILLID